MLFFHKRFLDGLKDGSITLTFRRWSKPQVKVGGRYRTHPIGVLDVTDLRRVSITEITEEEAQRAGFGSRDELFAYMSEVGEGFLDGDTEVYRVEVRYGGDGDRVPEALETDLTDEDVEKIEARLRKFDERSAVGPWTSATLELIAANPRVRAAKLAKIVGREKLDFKADVVKLKRLGLTQSFEIGYELSPRGRAYLDRRSTSPLPMGEGSGVRVGDDEMETKDRGPQK